MAEADGVRANADEVIEQFRQAQALMQQAKNLIDEGLGGIVLLAAMRSANGLRGVTMVATEARNKLDEAQFDLLHAQEEIGNYRGRL